MIKYFVFAEFGSARVVEFLEGLRYAFFQKKKNSPIHVTLRGPHARAISQNRLQELAELVRGYGVKIHSPGFFSTSTGYVVFLRAECSVFRDIWNKPDFDVSKFGIQPHITLFETKNKSDAERVLRFIKKEKIHIHTYDLYLSLYRSGNQQSDLFDFLIARPQGERPRPDIFRINDGVVERAHVLGKEILEKQGHDID
ncbi:hypothetical protein [Pseudacidovorax intermedius]|uniref:hypothetical protein n=1 Tax=Pseudacidovorax intermedius TaxID=433924 RepID=UPI0011C01BBB|nr:hypothetical protein [Pseudacidovorax intermedius]